MAGETPPKGDPPPGEMSLKAQMSPRAHSPRAGMKGTSNKEAQ